MKRFLAIVVSALMFFGSTAYASESLKYNTAGMLKQRIAHMSPAQKLRLKKAIQHHDLATAQAMLKLNKQDIRQLNRLGKQQMMKLSKADQMKLFGKAHAKTMMIGTHEQAQTEGAWWLRLALFILAFLLRGDSSHH